MSESARRREIARADRVLPGVWRLRLPLPWPGVPHVNAWALAAGSGVVLVDTGLGGPGGIKQLELAMSQAGFQVEHVRLVVCTHAHSDHYGLAGTILDVAGCELWMHPNHQHFTKRAADPEGMLQRRIEVARQSGVPEEALRRYQSSQSGGDLGVDRIALPDRDLLPGVEIQTDLGVWQVYETPGHAPSHVCLHQPDRDILISGDHLLGRVSLYYDYGYTPDPAGEFLSSLDVVDRLGARLCLSGHGRPFRDVHGHLEANRREVAERMGRVRAALEEGPKTPFEIVPTLMQTEDLTPMLVNWGLSETLCYLRHFELGDAARKIDGEEPERWALVEGARAA
ncbi:MAG: MBL fold metallo-hydrolase [Actinobacteria bacterium]|nr:MAG: MBL fold metallo-hydrolase [Actinomycetota bacterium]